MKQIFFFASLLFSNLTLGETITIEGQFKLGQKLFDKGVPAVLHLDIQGEVVNAEIEAPEATCIFKFGQGSLKSSHTENYYQKGEYQTFLLPLDETCSKFATNPLKLIVRKDFSGNVLTVSILQNSRRNRWHYFVSQ